MKFLCAHCGSEADRPTGHVKRSRARGHRLFCSRKCGGLGRRQHKPKAQKVFEKRLYDMEYRAKNRAMLKAKKHAYFRATYDPAKAAVERKRRMPKHVEYCRRPEYKKWKSNYDRQYRAREYGAWAECYLLLLDIDNEVNSRMSDYDVRMANGTLNKRQQRRREHGSLISGRP